MKVRDVIDLLMLASLWGAAFILTRVAVPEFGAIPLAEVRVVVASVFLIPAIAFRTGSTEMSRESKLLFAVGVVNTAFPLMLLSYAALYLAGGFVSIVNATAPMWGALLAWMWLGDRLTRSRVLGLFVGLVGVVILVRGKFDINLQGSAIAVIAALSAAFCYGIGANFTRRFLSGISSMSIATGSLIGASVAMLPFAIHAWPSEPISMTAWWCAIAMGIGSTAIAYLLYFRLIARIGATRSLSVTYLVPAFAVLWGATFIDERLTIEMTIGCLVILLGTALATGMLNLAVLNRSG